MPHPIPAALPVLALALIGAAPPGPDFGTRILADHNRERVALGVGPLAWDAGLARSAQGWADHLAATGAFAHAPDGAGDPQGENLWAGTRGRYTVDEMVDGWAREKRWFRPGVFPDTSITGREADVGHYTQMIWRQTRAVGCAVAAGAREDVLVCRYSAAGNWVGERPF
ncbi:CAP domain-containing protein [uncultured Sphingomonas sp.]|uniref:CAP domain-containing protein n=1 Tax=uncultured Sphingomonas sp. TaxID=158754 RepID=UPI0035CA4B33